MSRCSRTLLLFAIAAPLAMVSHAQEKVYYVSPDGAAAGDGTASRPWDLPTGLASPLPPGATLWLKGGSYTGPFASKLSGTSEQPVVVAAYPGERAVLAGAVGAAVLEAAGQWTEFRGLEIAGGATGVRVTGSHIKLTGCSVRDNGAGVVVDAEAEGVELAGNFVYGNRGEGILLRGGAQPRLLSANAVFGNAGSGVVAAPGEGEVVLEGNAVFRNGDGVPNLLLEREAVTLDANFTWHAGWLPGIRTASGCAGLAAHDNYFAGRAAVQAAACPEASLRDGTPGGRVSRAFLRLRPYDPRRALLVVDNAAGRANVEADLSRLLSPGDTFAVRRIGGEAPLAAGVYGGGTVLVPFDPANEFDALVVERTAAAAPLSAATLPSQDLKLWLKADGNLTLNGSLVSGWQDESGANTHAVQTAAASQPSLASGVVNGKPALRFDGVNDFMTFTLPLDGLTGMTVFLVSAALADLTGSSNGVSHAPLFWNETSGWGTVHVSPFPRMVKYRFGTGQSGNLPVYNRPTNLGAGFSVTTAVKNGSTESLYVNGSPVLTQTGKLTTLRYIRNIGNLGRGYNDNTYFNGYISEVIVYTRALSAAERQEVEQYLQQKYFPGPGNRAPLVSAGPDAQVTLPAAAALAGSVSDDGLPNNTLTSTWSVVTGPGAVVFGNPSAPATTASFAAPGFYTLRLSASDGELSASDDVAVTVNAPDLTPPAISNVRVTSLGHNSAALAWDTDEPSDTQAEYTPAGGGPLSTPLDAARVTSHAVTLTGLTPSTAYQFCVKSRDAAGNLASVCGGAFTTPEAPLIPMQGLRLWFKADAGLTLNGSQVSQWADQSGSGTHAAQATAASQPVLVPGAVNGLPAVRFDGTNDFMTFTLPTDGLTGMTILLVAADDSNLNGGASGAANAALFWHETRVWGALHLSPFQSVVKYRFGTGQYGNLPVYTRPAPIGNAFSVTTALKNGTTEYLFVNGTQVLTQTGKLAAIGGVQPTGNLARGYDNNTYFKGAIAEVLVYDRALSAAERQAAEQYLLTRYPRPNTAPVVNAGPDQAIAYPAAASLQGSATDDGVPGTPLTYQWSSVSGPAAASFSSPTSLATTASFPTPGTYGLRLTVSDGLLSGADDVTVVVNPPDTVAPVVQNIRVQGITSGSAAIVWDTNEPADSQVEYGLTASHGTLSALNPTLVTAAHSVTITGLQPDTEYHFSVRSRDAAGNLAVSPDQVFRTNTLSVVQGGLAAYYSLGQPAGAISNVNELQHPEQFENWIVWRNNSSAVTPDVAAAPDGSMTADRVFLRAPDGLLYHPYLSAAPGQTYTFSIYMRTEGGSYQLKLTRDNTVCWCGSTTPVLTVTEQWQRFSLTYTTAAAERASAVGFGYEQITNWNLPVGGSVLVWGAQVEVGSAATPYVPGNYTTPNQLVPDLSGLGNNGWLGTTAAASFDVNDPVRKTGMISFQGDARWVQAPHSESLDIRSAGSWVVLVKPDPAWSPWATFIGKANGAAALAQYSVGRYNNTGQLDFYNGNDNHPYRGGNIPTGVWSVLTVTLNGGVLKGYIDKTEVFSFTNVPDLKPVAAANLRLGTFASYPHYFRGDMAAALIYGRALTPAEIAQNCDFLKSTLGP